MMANISVQQQDYSPIISFGQKIYLNDQLTQNQANYIVKILEKYKAVSAAAGYDYRNHLSNLQWKQPFRILDLTKRIYVEIVEGRSPVVCLKFPYQLKKEFDDEIDNQSGKSTWDANDKVRKLDLYDCNLIQLYDFAVKHNFDIDESFMSAVAEVEEIWQNSEDLTPASVNNGNGIELKNAPEFALEYFANHRTHQLLDDAFLAKTMGYPLGKYLEIINHPIMKILTSQSNSFWSKDNQTFFKIYKCISGRACIILDRTADALSWLQQFVADADLHNISRDDIKVCFRENKDSKSGLNDWIRLAGVGGKVESGKILIFESKPAKWLFKDVNDVKMLVTNNLYPPSYSMTRDFFNSHPCVIYLGDIKPSEQKGQKIVEL
jgi:hypothetical protein